MDIRTAQAEAYDGLKARIAVAGFEDKMLQSLYYRPVYGIGMQDMLSTALFNTGRYIVLEREKLQAVLHEQDLGRIDRVRRETAAPIGEIEGAELLVQGAIIGFDPGNSGAAAGLGKAIGGEILGDVAQIAGSVTPAYVAMDLRVIDTKTGRVVAATSVEGRATGLAGSGGSASRSRLGSLSMFAKIPMEKAIRQCIEHAVQFIVAGTPQSYYHGRTMVSAPPRATNAMQAMPAAQVDGAPVVGRPGPVTPVNLLAADQGREPLRADEPEWGRTITRQPGEQAWHAIHPPSEAIYAFRDEQPATFTFARYIPKADGSNVKEFEVLVSSESPDGPFQSLGQFRT